jgi:hypothetical protein
MTGLDPVIRRATMVAGGLCRRPARTILTLYDIGAEIVASAAIAAARRLPTSLPGTLPIRQPCRPREQDILTLYDIGAEIFTSAATAPARRIPTTCRHTRSVRRPNRRPARTVLTIGSKPGRGVSKSSISGI